MYKAIDVAKYIVCKCIIDDCPISNLYLQNILYCVQREYIKRDMLAFFEQMEARGFGPCVAIVYYRFCGYGAEKIIYPPNISVEIAEEDRKIIDPIIERLRVLKPWDDEFQKIRKRDGAWDRTFQKWKEWGCKTTKLTISPIDIARYG